MPKAAPEVQWTMNNTLAAIGIEHAAHRRRAVAIGEKIGLYATGRCPRAARRPTCQCGWRRW
jgi:hypothetical protein